MSLKKMVILTKSKKYNNLCVAGIDIESGNWIRLVSEEEDIKFAVRREDLIYKDETEANILDCVEVSIKDGNAPWYHPENRILNTRFYLKYIRTINISELDNITNNQNENIFFNELNKISEEELQRVDDIYSLILIDVDKIYIHRSSFDAGKVFANFKYNNVWYKYIRITDIEFLDKYNQLIPTEGQYILNNVKLVLSLGEKYGEDYFKLIASIIE